MIHVFFYTSFLSFIVFAAILIIKTCNVHFNIIWLWRNFYRPQSRTMIQITPSFFVQQSDKYKMGARVILNCSKVLKITMNKVF